MLFIFVMFALAGTLAWGSTEQPTTPEFIKHRGYDVELHDVTTEDGYVITMHRIPLHGGKPILIQHGGVATSGDLVMMYDPKPIPFFLSDQGYDVWLGNVRGNNYGMSHVNMSIDEPQFWDFSWHEMGIYDLPAMIDYVLQATNQNQISYLGHSMGTTIFFVLMSSKPEYNDKISRMVALAPMAYVNNVGLPINQLIKFGARFANIGHVLGNALGLYRIVNGDFLSELGLKITCLLLQKKDYECGFQFVLASTKNILKDVLMRIKNQGIAGFSLKTVIHYSQEYASDNFCQFDYGESKNMRIYGSPEPPSYPVSKITVPMTLFRSLGDKQSTELDLQTFLNYLNPDIVNVKIIPHKRFQHTDYNYSPLVEDYGVLVDILDALN